MCNLYTYKMSADEMRGKCAVAARQRLSPPVG
jgi:hypothetical protein